MKNMAGKVTVGLASHWPCITDSSGIPTYGLNGLGKGDEQFGLRHLCPYHYHYYYCSASGYYFQ